MTEATNQSGRLWMTSLLTAIVGVVLGGLIVWTWLPNTNVNSADKAPVGVGDMGKQGPSPARVRVGEVREQTLADRVDVVGRLLEVRRSAVASEVEGKVIAAPIEAGDEVVGGETVLAKIDGVWATFELRETEAQVAAAQATFDQEQRDYDYLRTLLERGSAKPKEVDDAKAGVASSLAALDGAKAVRDRAKERVVRLKVIAPFDGVVVARWVEPGQWVELGTQVAEVMTTGMIDAEVFVPEQTIAAVQLNQTVSVTIEPLNEQVTGVVTAIVPRAANAARAFPVKVRLDDQAGRLKSGMSVVVHLPVSDSKPRLTVPRDAVVFTGSQAVVWTSVKDENATEDESQPMPVALAVSVNVLFGLADRYVIEPKYGDTLEPGTAVVVQGAERLTPNQPLKIDEPKTSVQQAVQTTD